MKGREGTTPRWRVKIDGGSLGIEAASEHEARIEALQALAEDMSLLRVERVPDESELPTVDEIQGILRREGDPVNGRRTETARRWWLDPTDGELSDVHHALRMIAQHPMVSTEDAARYSALADVVWERHFCEKAEAKRGN